MKIQELVNWADEEAVKAVSIVCEEVSANIWFWGNVYKDTYEGILSCFEAKLIDEDLTMEWFDLKDKHISKIIIEWFDLKGKHHWIRL